MKQKIFACCLAGLMVCSTFATAVFAEETEASDPVSSSETTAETSSDSSLEETGSEAEEETESSETEESSEESSEDDEEETVPICKIGTETYKSLADALTNAKEGSKIILIADAEESVSVPAGTAVTIDGGKKYTVLGGITAAENSSLTLKDLVVENGIKSQGILTLNGCTVSASDEKGNAVSVTRGSLTASNSTFMEKAAAHLAADECSLLSVTGCKFPDEATWSPIHALDSENIMIKDCTFDGKAAVHIAMQDSAEALVSGNKFTGDASLSHLQSYGCEDVSAEGNTFSGKAGIGIEIDRAKDSLKIENNKLGDSSLSPITVRSSDDITISGNTITGAEHAALVLSLCNDTVIRNNTISGWEPTENAIRIEKIGERLTVTGNKVSRSGSAATSFIRVNAKTGTQIRVTGNDFGKLKPEDLTDDGQRILRIEYHDGVPKTWEQINGEWYYFDALGTESTGWQLIDKKWYYFDTNGVMCSGWKQVEGVWYYLSGKNDGAMRTGWLKNGNVWYYLKGNGAMATGWQWIGGKWYYLTSSGAMAANRWIESGGKWYYVGSDGAMLQNTTINGYRLDSNGVWLH